jgi:hypothetical protein
MMPCDPSAVIALERTKVDAELVIDRTENVIVAWDALEDELVSFFAEAPAGIELALSYMPVPLAAASCSAADYPQAVPWGSLPEHSTTLSASIEAVAPPADLNGGDDGVMLLPVTRAALERATALQDQTPERDIIVLLLMGSWGDNTCDSGDGMAQAILGARSYNGVRTFIATVRGDAVAPAVLADVAELGGGTHVYDAGSDTTVLSELLLELLDDAGACRYVLAERGVVPDPTLLNLRILAGADTAQVPRFMGLGDCGSEHGYYFDDPTMPQKAILCPTSCEVVRAHPTGGVEVSIGCPAETL